MRKKDKEKLTAIEKAMEILVVFSEYNKALGTIEVSGITGINKATTSRILATLTEYGLVTQEGKHKKFNLGPLAYKLGVSITSQSIQALVDVSRPHIDLLRDKINETISLEVWAGNCTIAGYLAESHKPLGIEMLLADVLPLHAAAGAKAILSYLRVDYIDNILDDELDNFSENTINLKEELHRNLIEFNKQGYSIDNEELYSGIYAIGVPIFDNLHKPVAAIVAAVPIIKVDDEFVSKIVAELIQTSSDISQQINFN